MRKDTSCCQWGLAREGSARGVETPTTAPWCWCNPLPKGRYPPHTQVVEAALNPQKPPFNLHRCPPDLQQDSPNAERAGTPAWLKIHQTPIPVNLALSYGKGLPGW